jgi:hypothetical protein
MIELRFVEYVVYALSNIISFSLFFMMMNDKSYVMFGFGLVGVVLGICANSLYIRKILIPRLKRKVESEINPPVDGEQTKGE